MNKKGLAIIYDPHNLHQFIWYYTTLKGTKNWDALCLPNGPKGEYMHTYCENAQIFSKVYKNDTDYSKLKTSRKLLLFFKMMFYFILGHRKNFCQKMLNQYVKIDDYDEIVVIADVGIISGAAIAMSNYKRVVILEDGIADYKERVGHIKLNQIMSPYNWQGFLLSLMGYSSPGRYKLSTNKNCIKFCSQPDKMKYRDYKEIRQLYDMSIIDRTKFDRIIEKIYPKVKLIDFSDIDAVIFTRPLDDFVNDYEKYQKKIENYINENFKSILIKKHPREDSHLLFSNRVKITEVDNSIPAEVLLPYLAGKKIVLVTTSGIILYIKLNKLNCTVLDFDNLYEESLKDTTIYTPLSNAEVKKFCESFAEGCYEIKIL